MSSPPHSRSPGQTEIRSAGEGKTVLLAASGAAPADHRHPAGTQPSELLEVRSFFPCSQSGVGQRDDAETSIFAANRELVEAMRPDLEDSAWFALPAQVACCELGSGKWPNHTGTRRDWLLLPADIGLRIQQLTV